jgi:hypothetical protein
MPPQLRSLLDRFWEKVDTSGGPDACWPWRGAVVINRNGKDGYGVIQTGGRGTAQVRAHRFALVYATGEDPPDKEAGHGLTCTTTLCCNDRHLRWVSRSENERDKARKREDTIDWACLDATTDRMLGVHARAS